ncbi:MAG: nickel-dependent hydrogenase large subunit [Terasakiella sp.]|uniref:nickel-dependent hydrogenase large subunit n=1 Tax=unclassified Terasakiella TaxID=2614952 RepID=UPI003AFFBA30
MARLLLSMAQTLQGIENKMNVGADHIVLKLVTKKNRIEDVRIASNRTTMAARILEGKSPQEACAFVPLLFSLCGTAQHHAALTAMEQALGYVPSPAHKTARHLLLLAEGIAEHTTRLLIDWAELGGQEKNINQIRDIRQTLASFKSLIFTESGQDKIGGGTLAPDMTKLSSEFSRLRTIIQSEIFKITPREFADLPNRDALENWISTTDSLPARCLKQWQKDGLSDIIWPLAQGLMDFPPEEIAMHMDAENADQFITYPTWDGRPCQTGALMRHLSHPFLRQANHNALSYFYAKLIDLAVMIEDFEKNISGLKQDDDLYHTKATYKGYAQIEAVRGQLSHRVWINPQNDTIARYRILAPTEWNFHPNGILKQALIGVESADENKLKQIAQINVLALDPCVACRVDIEEQN